MTTINSDEVYSWLNEIFSEIFLRDDIHLTPATTAKDVEGWDSFKQIEIILAAEERFGIRIPTREVDRLANVGNLVEVIVGLTRGNL